MGEPTLPPEFATWEQARDYYALEALFLGQHYDRHKCRLNKRRYMAAARNAARANEQCAEPLPMDGDDGTRG